MISTQVNPSWLDPETYVAFLNRGFPAQWDRRAFEWYLRRPFAGRATDIIVRARGEQVVAGASFCYRRVVDGDGRSMNVCIASAGVTVPEERGRGHYRELLQSAVVLCRERACDALLGFVTRDNASGRGLARIGAYALPSWYLVTPAPRARRPGAIARRVVVARRPPETSTPQLDLPTGVARFDYADRADWRAQFVNRPHPVRAVVPASGARALIETVDGTDRLQWLSSPRHKLVASVRILAEHSLAAGRRFFLYTMDEALAAAARRGGMRARGGYLMLLPIESSATVAHFARAPWHLQSGDRM